MALRTMQTKASSLSRFHTQIHHTR